MNLGPAVPWLKVNGELCENPLWDENQQQLYWTDIPSGTIWSYGWENQQVRRIYDGPSVGGFTLQADGSLLLFRQCDIARFSPGGQTSVVAEFVEEGSTRFNDVIADPAGRVFAGTIGRRSDSGGLFRLERSGDYVQVASGTGCSNGLAFSPDLNFLYWVCSTRRRIFRFPYCIANGVLSEPTIFFQGDESDGLPDGLTVDHEGNLYSIRWGALEHGLIVLNSQGAIIHRQRIPPKASSSLAFCGPALNQLAITCAEDAEDPMREADLYLIKDMPVPGRAEFHSSIGL